MAQLTQCKQLFTHIPLPTLFSAAPSAAFAMRSPFIKGWRGSVLPIRTFATGERGVGGFKTKGQMPTPQYEENEQNDPDQDDDDEYEDVYDEDEEFDEDEDEYEESEENDAEQNQDEDEQLSESDGRDDHNGRDFISDGKPPEGVEGEEEELLLDPEILELAAERRQLPPRMPQSKKLERLIKLKQGHVRVPTLLERRIQTFLKGSGYSLKQLKLDGDRLAKLLQPTPLSNPQPTSKDQSQQQHQQMLLYRKNHPTIPQLVYKKPEVLAYLAHRVAGSYAAIHRVLNEIRTRYPDWTPTSMLDFGSGPGTAIWAAKEVWPHIEKFVAVEPAEDFLAPAEKLLDGITGVEFKKFLYQEQDESYDIVLAAFVLGELQNDKTRRTTIRSLWKHVKKGGLLVLLEVGSPLGFNYIKDARAMLINDPGSYETPASVVAPCPHSETCPMGGSPSNWCHFLQRFLHPQYQMAMKRNQAQNWMDTSFSYVAMAKDSLYSNDVTNPQTDDPNKRWARIVATPKKRGGHVLFELCTPHGVIENSVVKKSDGTNIYKEARKSGWSDGFFPIYRKPIQKRKKAPQVFDEGEEDPFDEEEVVGGDGVDVEGDGAAPPQQHKKDKKNQKGAASK